MEILNPISCRQRNGVFCFQLIPEERGIPMKITFFKTSLFVTLLLLCPIIGLAQQKAIERYDGSDWKQWNAIHKLSFIEGFLSGAHYIVDNNIGHAKYAGENFTPQKGAEKFLLSLIEKKETFTRQEMELLMEYAAYLETSKLDKYYVADTTVRKIVDGLDTFYFDSKNQKIKISDAVYLVKKKYRGHLLKRLKFSANGLGRILTPKSDIIRTRMEKWNPYLFLENLFKLVVMTSFISVAHHPVRRKVMALEIIEPHFL